MNVPVLGLSARLVYLVDLVRLVYLVCLNQTNQIDTSNQ